MVFTSLLRHILPFVAVYVTSPEMKEHISVAVAAGVAFAWSFIEKKAGISDGLKK